ncbi:MAG: DUF2075 domain-containing protein [Erysipelotrichaceae bacterium]|nr:DUF2075 domain-containing protein [Erysipelotrichaceae bacterium]
MIVYSATKEQFNDDVIMNRISGIILENMRSKHISGGHGSEYVAFQNSLQFMRNVIDDNEIPGDVNVAIEYQIPRTSKRVDFMIAGADDTDKNNIVVVELKQWTKVEKVDDVMMHSVKAFTGGANRIVNHPSYQAYAYSVFIKNSSEQVQDDDIGVIPCAYLHNYDPVYESVLADPIYEAWYSEAPYFIRDEVAKIRSFIKKYIMKKSSSGDLLYKIDNGRIRPSKALQDCLVSLMKGKPEFILLDDQAVAFDICRQTMKQCLKDLKKRTVIIQGGPGTGKSVLAVNLLKNFITSELNAAYCTKNSAPRNAYLKLLSDRDLKAELDIKQLFRSPFGLHAAPMNYYDCLIIDEAHRLVKQMYRDFGGKNQVMECINASLLSIFLIDEDQRITTKDIGSIDEIKRWANELNSSVISNESTILRSQFRCNGSDQYIQLLDNILQIGEPLDIDISELNFDIRVFDDPNELRNELREKNKINNKARMVAGYCYDWDVKFGKGDFDIFLENGFKAKWNLDSDKYWAINKKSFEQVGCIHTAQGLEFDYVGVLIGKDLRYDPETGTVITDRSQVSKDDKSSGIRSASDKVADTLIKNTYKTLLTRGQKGCYIYCEDKELRDYIKSFLKT